MWKLSKIPDCFFFFDDALDPVGGNNPEDDAKAESCTGMGTLLLKLPSALTRAASSSLRNWSTISGVAAPQIDVPLPGSLMRCALTLK